MQRAKSNVDEVIDLMVDSVVNENPRVSYVPRSSVIRATILMYLPSCVTDKLFQKYTPQCLPRQSSSSVSSNASDNDVSHWLYLLLSLDSDIWQILTKKNITEVNYLVKFWKYAYFPIGTHDYAELLEEFFGNGLFPVVFFWNFTLKESNRYKCFYTYRNVTVFRLHIKITCQDANDHSYA